MTLHPMRQLPIHAVLLTIRRTWSHPRCPSTNRWIMKTWHLDKTKLYSHVNKNETIKPVRN